MRIRTEVIPVCVDSGIHDDFLGAAMANIALSYRYRDFDNYKAYERVVFKNSAALTAGEIWTALMKVLGPLSLWPDILRFRPEWVSLPPQFLVLHGYCRTEADHDWHEIDGVEETDETPDDSDERDIQSLLQQIVSSHFQNVSG